MKREVESHLHKGAAL